MVLRHRLESVRIFPQNGEPQHDPITYGDVTAQAVAMPEIRRQSGPRVLHACQRQVRHRRRAGSANPLVGNRGRSRGRG